MGAKVSMVGNWNLRNVRDKMDCKEIIEKYLKENGFDGLRYIGGVDGSDNCRCYDDDIIGCGSYCGYCEPFKFEKPLDKAE